MSASPDDVNRPQTDATASPDPEKPIAAGSGPDDGGTTVRDDNLAARPNDGRTVIEPDASRTLVDDPAATCIESPPRLTNGEATLIGSGSRTTQPTLAPPAAPDLSRYTLVENFAQGGLGRIWKARDDRIQREVAFKELLPAALKNAGLKERFFEEAQITGQLEHPGIVPIYDLGWQTDGTPFYAMKLVRGSTYSKAIQHCHALPRESHEQRLAFVKLLQQFVAICNALAFAHSRGVIHRDLKPQNVMLGDFGETLVLDWGLAKIVGSAEKLVPVHTGEGRETDASDAITISQSAVRSSVFSNVRSEASQTVMGSVMGTPAYMPPEQALGNLQELDACSDIYSLGAILYEVLTGRQPIEKGTVTEMLARVVEGLVPPPRAIDATIPRPLEAIAVKAMSVTKTDRYATALDLARDVENYLADEQVSAYPEPWPLRAKRWMRRHRTAVTTASVAAGVLVVMWIAWSAVESSRVAGVRQRVQSAIAESQRRLEQDDFERVRTALAEALGLAQSEPKLAVMAMDVQDRLTNLKRVEDAQTAERLAALRTQALQKHDQAVFLIEKSQDYQAAARLLTESVTMLEGVPELNELRAAHRRRLDEIQQVLDRQKDVAAAQKWLREFQQDLDRARFYGSQFTGEQVAINAQRAKNHAIAAWTRYSDGLPPGMEHVPAEQLKAWQSHLLEIAFILADAEAALTQKQPDEERRGGLERALFWLTTAEKAFGANSKALWLMRSQFLRSLGRNDEAEQAEQAASTTRPETAWEFFVLAEIERRNNERYAAATLLYQRALDVDPDYFLALYFLGVCNLQRVQSMTALEGDSSADVSGYLNASVTAFTTCLTQRPEFPWPLLLRGVAYAGLQQFDRSFEDFARTLQFANAAEVHDAELFRYGIHVNRGAVSLQRERFADAATDFAAAMKLRPDNPDPHINQSEVHRRQKQYQPALVELTTAAKLDPASAKVMRFRGRIFALLDDEDAALKDYLRAAALEKSQKLAAADHYEIGRIHHRAGRLAQALAAYDQSLAADSTNPDVIRLRAETLLALNQTPQAIAGFSDFLKHGQPIGDVYRARGLALAKIGNYRAAMNDYTRSLELEPDSPNILTRRGWAYLLQAQQLALADFDEAIKQNPDNGDSYNGRGYARVMLGDYAAAVKDADDATVRGPKAFEIYYNAATIFSQAVAAVRRDKKLDDEARTPLVRQFTSRAIELLRQSAEIFGPQNRPLFLRTINGDSSLDPIRDDQRFKDLVAP